MKKKHRLGYTLCFVFIAFLCTRSLFSQDQTDEQIELTLSKAISLALESNLNIRIQRISPQIQDLLVTQAQGRFDPVISVGSDADWSEQPSLTPFITGAEVRTSNTQGFVLGFDDPIFTGGSYGLTFNSNRSESNSTRQTVNPAYGSDFAVNITQPLLEGFGTVNNSSIAIARNNKDISHLQLKVQLINTLSQVQNTYWELVFARENLKVQELAAKQAYDLLTVNQRRKEVGKATISDVLQAQAAVASREADVIAAQDVISDVEDRLKRITNLIQNEALWGVAITPVDLPPFETVDVNMGESITTALQNRPEYTQAKIDLENSDISIKIAKNQQLPRLDLEGSLAFNGLDGQFGDAFSQVGTVEHDSWRVGLFLRIPIGDRTAKSELKRSQLEKEQGLLALQNLEQRIITEAREAVRQLETDRKRIEATKVAEDFARQTLAAENKKYEVGLSTSLDLLQFQAILANASRDSLRSIIDYRQSVVVLHQVLGVTLIQLNIEYE